MEKKTLPITVMAAMAAIDGYAQTEGHKDNDSSQPNIVMITVDDIGYFDLSCYHRGLACYKTPNIDELAVHGAMVSDYCAQASSTAGRASLITGQYPIRTGLTSVGQPGSLVGLQEEDPTLAVLLKDCGYQTAIFGKWHLGDRNEFLPTNHGFDEFIGFMYHLNMMEMPEQPEFPKDPDYPGRPRNMVRSVATDEFDSTVDPRWGQVGYQKIKDLGPLSSKRMETIDEEFLEHSVRWIEKAAKKDSPYFLWFNPSRMHQMTHVGEEWAGKSGHSTYADGLAQLDAIVGELLDAIEKTGEMDNTIILFTGDNGVNLTHWPDAGTAGFRGEKGTTWDGGFRVPMLVQWKGHIPAGIYLDGFMTAEDWLPTLMAAAGNGNIKEELREGKTIGHRHYKVHIDGYNQLPMLTEGAPSNRAEFFYYGENDLNAVRVNQWKVHFAVKDRWLESATALDGGLIIDIKLDPFERSPESAGHLLWMKEKSYILPQIAPYLNEHRKSLKEFPPRQKGTGIGVGTL